MSECVRVCVCVCVCESTFFCTCSSSVVKRCQVKVGEVVLAEPYQNIMSSITEFHTIGFYFTRVVGGGGWISPS